jgi:hypothetical protein
MKPIYQHSFDLSISSFLSVLNPFIASLSHSVRRSLNPYLFKSENFLLGFDLPSAFPLPSSVASERFSDSSTEESFVSTLLILLDS